MQRLHVLRVFRGILMVVLFLGALLFQGLPSLAQPKDPPGRGGSSGQDVDKHGNKPCDEKSVQGGGQGYCYKHRFGSWGVDKQNFPTCTGGYVCNSPGAVCTDASNTTGQCALNPNSGNCDCECMH